MTDFNMPDISDAPRSFSVDEIIERHSPSEQTPEMFGGATDDIEALLRLKHQAVVDQIGKCVSERQRLNDQIRGLRRDVAILGAAVNKYDRVVG